MNGERVSLSFRIVHFFSSVFFASTPSISCSTNYSERIKQCTFIICTFSFVLFFHTLEKTEIILETFPSRARFFETINTFISLLNFV